MLLRGTCDVHHLASMCSEPIPMRKPPTGEPCAGEPHARFGGRGRRKPFPTPITLGCKFSSIFFALSVSPYPLRLTPHRITLSARASTFGRIVTSICFAAFRLMTKSNFFGCSTGRSAGLAPFTILSTKIAARRYRSTIFTP
jgi:hypothetical protein